MAQFLGFGRGNLGDKIITSSETVNVYTGCSGSADSVTLTVDNVGGFGVGDLILIHKSRGQTTTACGTWEQNRIASIGLNQFILAKSLDNNYQDSGNDQSQCVLIPEYRSLTIASGGILGCSVWDENSGGILIVSCSGKFLVQSGGIISLNGGGFSNYGWAANYVHGYQGEGTNGIGINTTNASNGNGGGGGENISGANPAPGGGGGGNGTAGTSGTDASGKLAGQGGGITGNDDLSKIIFGGEGGGGGGSGGADQQGPGGNGAGLAIIIAKEFDCSLGQINEIGIAGTGPNSLYGGGGGGAGGSFLLKAITANIGVDKINLTGGIGGDSVSGGDGGAGGKGKARIEACSLTGSLSSAYYGTYSESVGGHNFCGSVASII